MEISQLCFMVVEDDDFQRWTMERMLRGLGAGDVYSAADGHTALSMMASAARPVDIVVSDLDMPEMDGMEFIRRLSQDRSGVSLIISSSHDRMLLDSVATMAREYGVQFLASIEKPPTAAKMLAAVGIHVDREPGKAGLAQRIPYPIEELSEALRAGEIRAWFQPKVDIKSGRVVGAEALARWMSRAGHVVLPTNFVPDLERNGLMQAMTETILLQACSACAAWTREGVPASVSINISQTSLDDLGLADRMGDLVSEAGLLPHQLILEITESAAARDLGKALENLTRLRMRGFGLSIDDYGTGYSSVKQLSRIPFSELKIDQSFVRTAPTQAASRAILESSLEMAQKLGLKVVAEGVETEEEWALVSGLGCDMAQGWYVAGSMPANEFTAFARRLAEGPLITPRAGP